MQRDDETNAMDRRILFFFAEYFQMGDRADAGILTPQPQRLSFRFLLICLMSVHSDRRAQNMRCPSGPPSHCLSGMLRCSVVGGTG